MVDSIVSEDVYVNFLKKISLDEGRKDERKIWQQILKNFGKLWDHIFCETILNCDCDVFAFVLYTKVASI